MLHEGGWRRVVVTQPRRLAAVALARRVALEGLTGAGAKVAHQIRFESTRTAESDILFVTEGVLLRYVASDPLLSEFDAVIVDEVHERHLTTDFLLGCLKLARAQLLQQSAQHGGRTPFALVLMSATADTAALQRWLGGESCAGVIRVSGRTYPVEVEYVTEEAPSSSHDRGALCGRPGEADDREAEADLSRLRREAIDARPYIRILRRVERTWPCATERGDVLVFVSGTREISHLCAEFRRSFGREWVVLPLHAGLPPEEQDRVFEPAPDGGRKVVVATNVAETSLTVDGVRFVIDSGKSKQMTWVARWRTASLQEGWVSQASARQRAGRAGRTGPGRCWRLYSEAEHSALAEYTPPEIHRTPLDSVLLQVMAGGLGDPRRFPFVEQPARDSVERAMRSLAAAGCVTPPPGERLTPLGALLAQLPMDIPLGKAVVVAAALGGPVREAMLSIAAVMGLQGVWLRESQELQPGTAEYSLRHQFDSPRGDALTMRRVLCEWAGRRSRGERTAEWCRARSLSEARLREAALVRQQLAAAMHAAGLGDPDARDRSDGDAPSALAAADPPEAAERVEQAVVGTLAVALYPNHATPAEGNAQRRPTEQLYDTPERDAVFVHPSSSLWGPSGAEVSPGECIVYQQLLETQRAYLVGGTRAALAHSALLCAESVDLPAADGSQWAERAAVADSSLLLYFPSGDARSEALRSAAAGRGGLAAALRRLLAAAAHRLPAAARCIDAPDGADSSPAAADSCGGGLPQWLQGIAAAERGAGAAEAEGALERCCTMCAGCTARRLPLGEAAALYVPAGEAATGRWAADDAALGDRAALQPLKRGRAVLRWLRYGALLPRGPAAAAAAQAGAPDGEGRSVSAHLRRVWRCPRCGDARLRSSEEVAAHLAGCAAAVAGAADPGPAAAAAEHPAGGSRVRWECPECGRAFRFTPQEAARHQSSCAAEDHGGLPCTQL
eukprot:TRINITY_DN25769_c0_g1_i1.p1 TRINITY_DN25769_c0_g1~~TRINITY_DN25769_c0_g1_i1.p1  ORF type:complete len:960 (+),score=247.87 TRINITY_DN25769_c0_g1_i1:576-3455(+)